MTRTLRIGTRGSRLALAQSQWVQGALERLHSDLECRLVTIKTSGDVFVDRSLRTIGGKGLFIKEIEEALLAGDIDCAVHSMKDLPAELAPGLVIAAVPEREDPCDLFIPYMSGRLGDLPGGARIGTSSLRRAAFVRQMRPELEVVELRGNVDSRLRKLDAAELDAVILAAAGLRRMGIVRTRAQRLDPHDFVPAIGQGALAVECRAGEIEHVLAPLTHEPTRVATVAERAFLAGVGGSCLTPLGAHATIRGETLELLAVIASPGGRRFVRDSSSGAAENAGDIGARLAAELLERGGAEILRELQAAATA